jgi:2-keto-4-pentenoate hydratase
MLVDLDELARRMLADYDARTPGRLFAEPGDLTAGQAYALQAAIARLREARGERVIGYEVGCTSQAVRQQLGVAEPIYARVFDAGRFPSGATLSFRRFANLAVEGELAVRLGREPFPPPGEPEACRAAIASVFPVIELHHYVLRRLPVAVAVLIATGGLHAGYVAAERESEVGLAELEDLGVWIDDRRVGTVAGADLAGAAVRSVSRLARRLAEAGQALAGGQVVLTGSLLRLYPVSPGSRVAVVAVPVGRSAAEIGP